MVSKIPGDSTVWESSDFECMVMCFLCVISMYPTLFLYETYNRLKQKVLTEGKVKIYSLKKKKTHHEFLDFFLNIVRTAYF